MKPLYTLLSIIPVIKYLFSVIRSVTFHIELGWGKKKIAGEEKTLKEERTEKVGVEKNSLGKLIKQWL